jgi:hypothetical protein
MVPRKCCLILLLPIAAFAAENRTTPGELVVDPPTLINLGFEWLIRGDDNRNASVEVAFRKAGQGVWKKGLPLPRLQGEEIYQGQGVFHVVSPNMFAGSILDLDPIPPTTRVLFCPIPMAWPGKAGKALPRR